MDDKQVWLLSYCNAAASKRDNQLQFNPGVSEAMAGSQAETMGGPHERNTSAGGANEGNETHTQPLHRSNTGATVAPGAAPSSDAHQGKDERSNEGDGTGSIAAAEADSSSETFKVPRWASRPQQVGNWLIDQRNETTPQHVSLDNVSYLVFGRDPSRCSNLIERASRLHAAFVWHTNGKLYCIDLAGKRTTKIDGHTLELHKPKHVHQNSIITLGDECSLRAKLTLNDGGSEYIQQHDVHRKREHNTPPPPHEAAPTPSTKRSKKMHLDHDPRLDGAAPDGNAAYTADATPASVRCKHILVRHAGSRRPKGSTRTEDEAAKRADMLRERVKRGERFEDVAAAESECGSARTGGDVGTFGPGKMQQSFESASFALAPGCMTEEPVHSESGVHIIWRVE